MQSTTTVHWNAGAVAREHNQRDVELCKNEQHIDLKNEHGQSFHEVLIRNDLRDAYESIFGDEIKAYNARQKRRDRWLTVDDYMQSILDDTRGKKQTKAVNGKRVVKEGARQGKQLSYEITCKVGNTERKKDENGRTKYDFKGRYVRYEYVDRDIQQEALRRYAYEFQRRNPNLVVINADLHCDEGFYNAKGKWEYACDGLHLEVIPVATGFKQGLAMQNSMNKALCALGYSGVNAYNEWAKDEQDVLAGIVNEICKERQKEPIEFYHPVKNGQRDGDKEKEDYIAMQELQELKSNLEADIARLQADRDNLVKELEEYRLEFEKSLTERFEALQAYQDEIEKEFQKREDALDAQKSLYADKCVQLEQAIQDLQFPVETAKDKYMQNLVIGKNRRGFDVTAYSDFYNKHIAPRTERAWRTYDIVREDIAKDDSMSL